MQENKGNLIQIISILFCILLISLFFLKTPGTGNMDTWIRWANTVDESGIIKGFSEIHADYPPLSMIIIFVTTKLSQGLGIWNYLSIKLTLFVFLSLTAFIFWRWTKNFFLSLLFYFSLLVNSLGLGHLDVFYAPTLILSLWALKEKKWVLFSLSFTISFLTKWQPIILAPFIAIFLLNISKFSDLKKIEFWNIILKVFIPLITVISLTLFIFGIEPILSAFLSASNHSYFSGNAFNLNWVITHFLHVFSPEQFGPLVDGQASIIRTRELQIRLIPRLIFIITYAITFFAFYKREKSFNNFIVFALLGYSTYFMFNPGVHENHLFIPVILSIILFWLNKKQITTMLLYILVGNMNLILFNGVDGLEISYNRTFNGIDIALLFSLFSVIVFLIFWLTSIISKKNNHKKPLANENIEKQDNQQD